MDEYDDYDEKDSVEFDDDEAIYQLPSSSFNDLNAYPDPEDIPSYPWLGSSVTEKEKNALKPPLPPKGALGSPAHDTDGAGCGDDSNSSRPTHVRFDFNNASVDPDFQFSGDSAMCVYSLKFSR